MIGDIDVDQAGQKPGSGAHEPADEEEHGHPREEQRAGEDRFDRGDEPQPQKVKNLPQVEGQRAIDIEERVAVTEGDIWRPTRVPHPILYRAVELEEEIDAVAGVMSPPEVARLE